MPFLDLKINENGQCLEKKSLRKVQKRHLPDLKMEPTAHAFFLASFSLLGMVGRRATAMIEPNRCGCLESRLR